MVGSAATIIIAAQECNQVFTIESITIMLVALFMFITIGLVIYIQQKKSFEDFIERMNERWNGSQDSTGSKE